MTAISRLAFWFSLLAALAVVEACTPWYVKYGIKDDTELQTAGAAQKLLPALLGTSCGDIEEAALMLYALAPETEEVAVALGKALDGECGKSEGLPLARALGRTGSHGFAVLKAAMASPDGELRTFATVGLGELKEPSPGAIDLLVQKIASDDPLDQEGARLEAFTSLGKLSTKAKGALPTLIRLLTDDSWRSYALQTIDGIGYPDPGTIKALQVLMESESAMEAKPILDKLQLLAAAEPVVADPAKPAPKLVTSKNVIVAVFDVQDSIGAFAPKTLDQLTLYITNQMTQTAGYRVVPREQLRARLADEKSGSFKKCFDESCQIELGKALAAQKTLSTQLLKVGTRCMVVSNMFDLKTETSEKAASSETDCSENQLIDALRAVAQQYAE
jgi:hypothetical protein